MAVRGEDWGRGRGGVWGGGVLPRLLKKHGRRGRGLLFLYIYTENFKNLLVRNQQTDFNEIHQNCVVTIYQVCSSYDDLLKNMAARG